MKATVEIDDHLYREAKAMAVSMGRKMKDTLGPLRSGKEQGGFRSHLGDDRRFGTSPRHP